MDFNQALDTVQETRIKWINLVIRNLRDIKNLQDLPTHARQPITYNTNINDLYNETTFNLNNWMDDRNGSPTIDEVLQIYCDTNIDLYTRLYDGYHLKFARPEQTDIYKKALIRITNILKADPQFQSALNNARFAPSTQIQSREQKPRDTSKYLIFNPNMEIYPPHADLWFSKDICFSILENQKSRGIPRYYSPAPPSTVNKKSLAQFSLEAPPKYIGDFRVNPQAAALVWNKYLKYKGKYLELKKNIKETKI